MDYVDDYFYSEKYCYYRQAAKSQAILPCAEKYYYWSIWEHQCSSAYARIERMGWGQYASWHGTKIFCGSMTACKGLSISRSFDKNYL